MKTKPCFTPGPWWVGKRYDPNKDWPDFSIESGRHFVALVCDTNTTINGKREVSEAEVLANAHLIASAPAMFVALVRLCEAYRRACLAEDHSGAGMATRQRCLKEDRVYQCALAALAQVDGVEKSKT